jgi:hypothetical protein
MIINLDVPGGHGRIRLPGGWPGLAELADVAHALAESARRCPDCPDVLASEFLRAMARVAPADLAAALRELAGPETASGPGKAEQALAALYEKHAAGLAAIEAAYKAGPPQTAR